jgi:hypothetical protein
MGERTLVGGIVDQRVRGGGAAKHRLADLLRSIAFGAYVLEHV